jgi:hypothetical protein
MEEKERWKGNMDSIGHYENYTSHNIDKVVKLCLLTELKSCLEKEDIYH